MRRALVAMGICCALVLAAGCGDDTDPKPKDASQDKLKFDTGVEDGGADITVDTLKPDTVAAESNLGEGCAQISDCKKGSPLCLSHPVNASLRICSRSCTPDNTTTPLINEDDCPDGFLCASFAYTTATYNYCLKKCTPNMTTNPCPANSGTTCDPVSTRWGALDQAVCFEPACKTDKDCPVLAAKTCTVDGDCTSVGTDAFCDEDTYLCARPGKCTAGGLCGVHTYGKTGAKVGDPCSSDLDCPSNGRCLTASTSSSSIGTHYNNGYCIIAGCSFANLTEFACATGSTCFKLYYGGYCHKSCAMSGATDCRNIASDKGGDYECYAWNNLSIGGVSVSATPVCASAANQTCDSLGTTLDCTSLGEQGNTTNMGCRDRYTGVKKTNAADPSGVCLDDTASGPFQTAVDAGVSDSAPVDAGTADTGTTTDTSTTVDAGAAVDAPVAD